LVLVRFGPLAVTYKALLTRFLSAGRAGVSSQAPPSLSVTVFNKQQLAGTGKRMDGMSGFYLK
jgi:hypothetical protein